MSCQTCSHLFEACQYIERKPSGPFADLAPNPEPGRYTSAHSRWLFPEPGFRDDSLPEKRRRTRLLRSQERSESFSHVARFWRSCHPPFCFRSSSWDASSLYQFFVDDFAAMLSLPVEPISL